MEQEKLITAAEIACIVGVSRATISRWVRERSVPFRPIRIKKGFKKLYRYRLSEIEKWLEESKDEE